MTYHLGVDVGATTTRCAIATEEVEVLTTVRRPTVQGPTVEAFAAGIERVLEEAFATSGVAPDRIATAGVASFGPLDADAGVILDTPNAAADLRNVPVERTVAGVLPEGTPVVVLNDAVAGAVAEHERGGDDANVVYLTVSSGVGAGAVVDDHLLRGRGGNAAEVGHVTLDPTSDRRCGCGGTGHWEAFVGGENVPEYALEIHDAEGIDTSLPTDRDELTAPEVFAHDGDDPLATAVVDRIGRWNTLGVANLTHAFAPDRIAVGGGVTLADDTRVVEPIRDRIEDHLVVDPPEVHVTPFGDEVVLVGALLRAVRSG